MIMHGGQQVTAALLIVALLTDAICQQRFGWSPCFVPGSGAGSTPGLISLVTSVRFRPPVLATAMVAASREQRGGQQVRAYPLLTDWSSCF